MFLVCKIRNWHLVVRGSNGLSGTLLVCEICNAGMTAVGNEAEERRGKEGRCLEGVCEWESRTQTTGRAMGTASFVLQVLPQSLN